MYYILQRTPPWRWSQ